MFKRWEFFLKEVVQEGRRGLLFSLLRGFLWLLSLVFQRVVICRNWLFDQGWFRSYYPPARVVISVGNIVVGGTGKTPVTLMIAKAFYERYEIAILSRGYRSPAENLAAPLILCRGNGPRHSALYCGDEPFLFAQNLPKSHVFVGRNRQEASRLAAGVGADIILLDDGMQHRRLARDFEVIVVNALNPFGNGYFLPRGYLREGPSALVRGNLVIVNHVKNQEDFQFLKKEIRKFTTAPVVGTRWKVGSVWSAQGQQPILLEGKKIGMLCGIAHPDSFRTTLRNLGAVITCEKILPDHVAPDSIELQEFSKKCYENDCEWIVCTEKDKVKLNEYPKKELKVPIAWLQMELEVVEGHEEWKGFLQKIESKVRS